MTQTDTPIVKRGRPPKAAAQTREPTRDTLRDDQVRGRNGEILSRTRTDVGDPFAITDDMREPGWDMQWNVISVINNKDVVRQQANDMYANGWRPVPASRFDGRYYQPGYEGAIELGGQRLEERPMELSLRARADELRKAGKQMTDRNEALKLAGVNRGMPQGFEMNERRYRGTGGNIKMSIDPGLDIPGASHELAGPGE